MPGTLAAAAAVDFSCIVKHPLKQDESRADTHSSAIVSVSVPFQAILTMYQHQLAPSSILPILLAAAALMTPETMWVRLISVLVKTLPFKGVRLRQVLAGKVHF